MTAFEDRQECAYCRDDTLQPPERGSFRRDWEKHKAEHVVDKLEPAPQWLEPMMDLALDNLRRKPFDWYAKDDLNDLPEITFEETFEEIFDEAFDLLVERQHKYGPKNIERLGLWGVFDRLASDKIERVRRAFNGTIENGVVALESIEDYDDESFEDALMDIANYALIMIALKRGVWGRPLRSEVEP